MGSASYPACCKAVSTLFLKVGSYSRFQANQCPCLLSPYHEAEWHLNEKHIVVQWLTDKRTIIKLPGKTCPPFVVPTNRFTRLATFATDAGELAVGADGTDDKTLDDAV
jgi:hypothetical protein